MRWLGGITPAKIVCVRTLTPLEIKSRSRADRLAHSRADIEKLERRGSQ
jgi:hypothetical protein